MQVKKEYFFVFYERKHSFLRNIQKIVKKQLTSFQKGRILLTTSRLKKVKMMRIKIRKTVKYSDVFSLLLL